MVAKFQMVFGQTVILDTVTLNCCMIILWGVCFCLWKKLGLQSNLIESFKIEPYFTSKVDGGSLGSNSLANHS